MSATSTATFRHLDRLSDHRGLFEHAAGTVRREEHGYCTDDNARLLMLMSREPDTGQAHRLGRLALGFIMEAQDAEGQFRNRMDRYGRWTDRTGTDDCWGRALWGLGVAATHHDDPLVRQRALQGFDRSARQRSRWSRAMAFAALGAADVLNQHPGHGPARSLLADAVEVIGPVYSGSWTWPERRLRYANAALAEAVIAAGAVLERPCDLERGLSMLAWLLDLETASGHLSVAGVDGRDPDDSGPQFDQQPIEVATMADACWRAYTLTGNTVWSDGVLTCAAWFGGANDAGLPMFDDESGGGFDGLQPTSVNLNQGAESTLAFLSTMQRSRSFASLLS